MSIKLGATDISAIYKGSVAVTAVYKGVTEVWTSFSPVSLFPSGQKGAFYDPGDISTLFQDAGGTTPVTTAGQSVGKVLDKSGNNLHLIATGIIYRIDAYGKPYLEFNGSTSELVHAFAPSLVADMDFFFTAEVPVETSLSSSQFIALYGAQTGSHYLGTVNGGVAATNSSGNPTIAVNGVLTAGSTGNDVRALFGTGQPHVLEIRNANMTYGYAAIMIGKYHSSLALEGKFYGAILCPAQTSDVRAKIRDYFYSKSGLTLPRPVSGIAVGDSNIAAYSGTNSVFYYVDTVFNKQTIAVPSDTIARQKRDFSCSAYKTNAAFVVIQVGLNDLDPAVSSATTIAALQSLVDTVRAAVPETCKVLISKLTPCKARLDVLYGGGGYTKWQDVNSAIAGGGSTPITGVDYRVVAHEATLNDGSGNLAVTYSLGDNIHLNNAGRQVVGLAWKAALTSLGVL